MLELYLCGALGKTPLFPDRVAPEALSRVVLGDEYERHCWRDIRERLSDAPQDRLLADAVRAVLARRDSPRTPPSRPLVNLIRRIDARLLGGVLASCVRRLRHGLDRG